MGGAEYQRQHAQDLGMPIGTGKLYSYNDLRKLLPADHPSELLPIETELYAPGWIPNNSHNIPDIHTAQEIAYLFIRNYPPESKTDTIKHDFPRYRTGRQIVDQIQDGNAWMVARVDSEVIAALKFRRENRSEDSDREEILLAWILVEGDYREQGVASNLIRQALEILQPLKSAGKPVHIFADVLFENDPSRQLFNKLGFIEKTGKSPEFLTVEKIL